MYVCVCVRCVCAGVSVYVRGVCVYVCRAGPRTLECGGGGASGPDPEQWNTGYDVCGVSRKGGEYARGSPPLI